MMGNIQVFRTTALLSFALFATTGCLLDEPESGFNGTIDVNSQGLNPPSANDNSPPTISGTPTLEVTAGDEYVFTPVVTDADGDPLSFTISGLPQWATFDEVSGELRGTPESSDVGTYSNIFVTVTDGSENVSIGPFQVTVIDRPLRSVTLSWQAPTENEDGSALEDLDGYRLYWGTTPGSYTESETIDNESITTYVIENLPTGTYEFVATSFNSAGVESRHSSPVTKTVM